MSFYCLRRAMNGAVTLRQVAGMTAAVKLGEIGPISATSARHALRIAERLFETPQQAKRRIRPTSVGKLMRQHRELTTYQLATKFGVSEQRVREITRRSK